MRPTDQWEEADMSEVNTIHSSTKEDRADVVMPDGPRASNDVNYLYPLAERELSGFFHAVDQLFGAKQARLSALDWIDEMEAMSWPVGEAIPNWRQATIRASARLCSLHLRHNASA
jgi:hypothetical protein